MCICLCVRVAEEKETQEKEVNRKGRRRWILERSSDEEEEEEEEDGRNAGVNEAAGVSVARDVQDYRALIKSSVRELGGRLTRGKVTQGNAALVVLCKARGSLLQDAWGKRRRLRAQPVEM